MSGIKLWSAGANKLKTQYPANQLCVIPNLIF